MGEVRWWAERIWYGWGGKPPRRATGSVRTTATLPDGSKVTTTSTTYTRGPSTVKTTHSYRLPDGSRQTVSRTAPQTKQPSLVAALVAVVIVVAIAISLGKLAWDSLTRTPYQDGRSWALTWQTSFGFPEQWIGCNFQDMASSGQVVTLDGRHVGGDGKPNDNYSQWLAGCRSAKSYYLAQLRNG